MKPSLTWDEQVALLVSRGLVVDDEAECRAFLQATNYYRFSGYARYFQQAPDQGNDMFRPGTTFGEIKDIYEGDEALRAMLVEPLERIELLLRTRTAYVIAHTKGPYGRYLEQGFYTNRPNTESTVGACLRDLERSREDHILRFRAAGSGGADFGELPIWSAVEAWSFGTLSKCIERGATGTLADDVATSIGVAKAGFANRVRTLVYLRNRCAHHSRLWHHSVIDSGPTPNNVRGRAKRLAGQFGPRSVVDVIASLDDILAKSKVAGPVLPDLLRRHDQGSAFWTGLADPQNPHDHRGLIARPGRSGSKALSQASGTIL